MTTRQLLDDKHHSEDYPKSLETGGEQDKTYHQNMTRYVTELFLQLAKFLHHTLNDLKTLKDWQNFYAYLVLRLVEEFNKEQMSEDQHIMANEIRMPATKNISDGKKETADVIALTRLLYQAMVPVRLGVADGQHRLLATLLVLQGRHVNNSLSRSPPFYFSFLRDRGIGYGIQTFGDALQGKCNVRFVYHEGITSSDLLVRNFENVGEAYSTIRDTSQTCKRPRSLCDM